MLKIVIDYLSVNKKLVIFVLLYIINNIYFSAMTVKEQKRLEGLFLVYGFSVDVPQDKNDRYLKMDLLCARIRSDMTFIKNTKLFKKLEKYYLFASCIRDRCYSTVDLTDILP